MSRRRLLAILRITYLAGAAALLAWLIIDRWDTVRELVRETNVAWLVGALVMSFGMLGLAAELWRRLLVAQGASIRRSEVLHATARAVLARYVPGSIWFSVGRATLLGRLGVAAGPLTTTAVIEMILSVTTTIAGGALILGIVGALPGGATWAVIAAIVLGVGASPAVFGRVVTWVASRRGVDAPSITWRAFAAGASVSTVFWAWSAATFSVYLRAFPITDGFALATVAGGFLFAWGVGFLAVFAPQGVGVFEVTLAAILVDQGLGETALVIGGYRVVILIRDAIATAVAEATARRFDPSAS